MTNALDSLISQNESDWEALIIDDGSTDDTQSMVQRYLNKYPHISYINQKNKGEEGAKNTGICNAHGEYITFLDSDDAYHPDHLKTRKTIFQKHPEIDMLHGGFQVIGNEYVPDRFDPQKKIHLSECAVGGTFFIRKELLLALNGFRKVPIGTDADLLERVNRIGATIHKVDHPTYIYNRKTSDSLTHSFSQKHKTVK